MRQRLLALFDVEPGEGVLVSLMMAHSFAMGLTTVWFETAANALFLDRYPSSALALVYLAAAALNTGAGLLYTRAQARVGFRTLMMGTLVLLLVTTVGFRAALSLSGARFLLFALVVWYRAVAILTDLEYWAVAGRLFDVRQAKRLFAVIGSGEVMARIAGAFCVPVLVPYIGVPNLLLLATVALGACLVLLQGVFGHAPAVTVAPARHVPRPGEEEQDGLIARLRGDRYLGLIVLVGLFGVFGKYFLDFVFLQQTRSRFASAAQIASFLGAFAGVTQTLSLLTRVFVSGRLLRAYGVRVGLLVLPAGHLALSLLMLVAGSVSHDATLVFWLTMANQGLYKVLKHPIDNASFKVLYQPLRADLRLATQIAVETIVTPLTIGAAGLVMLAFSRGGRFDPVVFSWALLFTFGPWTLAAAGAGRHYATALVEALRGRLGDIHLDLDDARTADILEKALRTGRAQEALFALDLLERSAPARLAPLLGDLIDHPLPDVRLAALLVVERSQRKDLVGAVRKRVASAEDPPAVRAAALRALCAMDGTASFDVVSPHLEDPDPQVRMGALIGLLRQGSEFANTYLANRATSQRPERRAWAARVMGEAGMAALHEPLRALLRDPDGEVRRAALAATGRVRAKALWPDVVAVLADGAFCGAAAQALVTGGEGAVPALVAGLHTLPIAGMVRAARVLGRIGGPAAIDALCGQLTTSEEQVRHQVVAALSGCGWHAEGKAVDTVRLAIAHETADAAWKLAAARDLTGLAELDILRDALKTEMVASRDRLLLLLSLVVDRAAILRAREHLADAAREKRAYALEILDVTVPADLRPALMPLLDGGPDPLTRLLSPPPPLPPRVRLRELLEQPLLLAPWTQACVVDAAARIARGEMGSSLETLRGGRTLTALVRQTIDAALALPGSGTGGVPMLTIEKVLTLKSVDMFSRASEDVLAEVAAILEEVRYKEDEVVIRKGEKGDSMYIIIEGRVRVYDGERTIVFLGERDIFGELALLDPEPRFASVAASEPVRLFRLDRDAFLELMTGNIEIVRGVLHVLCDRLRRTVSDREPRSNAETAPVLTPPGS